MKLVQNGIRIRMKRRFFIFERVRPSTAAGMNERPTVITHTSAPISAEFPSTFR
jgi:hypothetical protein